MWPVLLSTKYLLLSPDFNFEKFSLQMAEPKKSKKFVKYVTNLPVLRKVLGRKKAKMAKSSLNCFRGSNNEPDHDELFNDFYHSFDRMLSVIQAQSVKDMIMERLRNGDLENINIYNDNGNGNEELMQMVDRDIVNMFDDELNRHRANNNVALERHLDIYGNIVRHIISKGVSADLASTYGALNSVTHAKLQRAYEMKMGIDLPKNWNPFKRTQLRIPDPENQIDCTVASKRLTRSKTAVNAAVLSLAAANPMVCFGFIEDNNRFIADGRYPAVAPPNFLAANFLRQCSLVKECGSVSGSDNSIRSKFLYFLVPDLISVVNCSFYWGKIHRCDAEKLLEDKSDGTFLLRDSTQNDYVFSVSFRKYGRSLHARIEQWNHMFSFDSHDPTFFASDTICGLIQHYNDVNHVCLEPSLLTPVHRNNPFSLKNLSRAVIATHITYSAIELLQLPSSLKNYLKEYHYKQKVRIDCETRP